MLHCIQNVTQTFALDREFNTKHSARCEISHEVPLTALMSGITWSEMLAMVTLYMPRALSRRTSWMGSQETANMVVTTVSSFTTRRLFRMLSLLAVPPTLVCRHMSIIVTIRWSAEI